MAYERGQNGGTDIFAAYIRLIGGLAQRLDYDEQRPLTLMEVCGTHTMSIYRWGIKRLLPDNIRLISGPGCPVCVTPEQTLAQALALSERPELTLASFGDMLRVPLGGRSLLSARQQGADIRIVLSPLDAMQIAIDEPARQVVFLAVGFETTAPLTAAVLEQARERHIDNFSVIAAHKTMPPVIRALFSEGTAVDGLICPGHVAAITGARAFDFVASELHKPSAVAGFEPADIAKAIYALVKQAAQRRCVNENCYRRAVSEAGNVHAQALLRRVFEPAAAEWRGLGSFADSGLTLSAPYADFDALARFAPSYETPPAQTACRCGDVLRGRISAGDCPLFGGVCTPQQPQGACMVSAEGGCAAAYKYRER
ncbi:MAG: hydrogenase formation protein HypD [Bacillota bacterium]|nr:hydrogenase formation protein HypD [Bacillota bacterium]